MSGLQWKMTLWVAGSVVLLSAIILFCVQMMLYKQFNIEVDDRLKESIDWTTNIIEQRMLRVENSIRTAASLSTEYLTVKKDDKIDSLLYHTIKSIKNAQEMSIVILETPTGKKISHNSYRTTISGDSIIIEEPYEEKDFDNDENWVGSYLHGRCMWSDAYKSSVLSNVSLICCSMPVYDSEGNRRGIICSEINQDWITDVVREYKARKDIDVSIYDAKGTCLVEPDDYILKLSEDELIRQERNIKHLNWNLVFSADKRIVQQKMYDVLLNIVGIMLLLLVTIAVTIALVVRFVARPFVIHQQETAEAKAAMQRELDIAAGTQRELVPHTFPPFPRHKEIDAHACLHPAKQVGGDLYDYFIEGDELFFCIGDVSGKGVPAALFMAATHYLFRNVAANMPISEAIRKMNLSLCTDNTQCMFVTFWFGRLNMKTGTLEYVNAGHNSPMLLHEGKIGFMQQSDNMPLGVWEEEEYLSHTTNLSSGDILLLYTDGITEAMNCEGRVFGDDAALATFGKVKDSSAKDIIDHITKCVNNHAEGAEQSDDITMLCIKIEQLQTV